MIMYELIPTNGRKSFNRKALVLEESDGKVLLSYGTRIMKIFDNGSIVRYWDDWTTITGTHIKSFSGLNKKEFLELPLMEDF